jgi:hypothetical protein
MNKARARAEAELADAERSCKAVAAQLEDARRAADEASEEHDLACRVAVAADDRNKGNEAMRPAVDAAYQLEQEARRKSFDAELCFDAVYAKLQKEKARRTTAQDELNKARQAEQEDAPCVS